MDLNRLRTFLMVVDSGGVTQAARKLHRTPQAVSIQLKQLEASLGFHVLQTLANRVVLTDAGRALYNDLKPQLSDIERSVEKIRAGREQASGLIRIGLWQAQASTYLPGLVEAFAQRYAGVRFAFRVGDDQAQLRWLEANEIDLAFVAKPPRPAGAFQSRIVYSQALLPVVSRDFFQRHPPPDTLRQTLPLPLIDFPEEFSAYQSWVRLNGRALLPEARRKAPVAVVDNSLLTRELVLRGLGFGFVHRELVAPDLASGRLHLMRVPGATQDTMAQIRLLTPRRHSLGFIHQQFIDAVLAARTQWRWRAD